MGANIGIGKPNRILFIISVFLVLLIAQIFWLGWEIEKLKTTIEQNEKNIDVMQSYILKEIRKKQRSKFI